MSKELIEYLHTFITPERKEKFENNIKYRTKHITVAIEDVFQSHNASAVLRSCECFGVQDVHIIENKNEYIVNNEIDMGASKWLNLHKYNNQENNTLACISALKSKGYQVIATTPHENDVLLDDLDLTQKTALLFGTELDGLTEEALNNADGYVKIPMYGFTESFNISVSAALSLFHLTEKLKKSDIPWQLTEKEREEILLQWQKNTIKAADKIIEKFLSEKV